jgi:hypothetical protein
MREKARDVPFDILKVPPTVEGLRAEASGAVHPFNHPFHGNEGLGEREREIETGS